MSDIDSTLFSAAFMLLTILIVELAFLDKEITYWEINE